MPTVCINRPNRTRKRVYTERDVGRIVGHAREDGANDPLLIAYILQGFGIRDLACLIFEIIQVLTQTAFLGAIVTGLSGLLTFLKGLKIVLTGRRSTFPGLVELFIPKRFLGSLGAFLVGVGALQTISAVGIAFISAMANNLELLLLMQGVCEAETFQFSKKSSRLSVGGLTEQLKAAEFKLRLAAGEIEE